MFNMEEGNSGAFPRLVFHIADVVESPSWLFSDLGQSLVQWTLCWLLMLNGFAWLDRVLLSWRTRIKDNERWWKYILKLGRIPARLLFPCCLVPHISKIIARLLGGRRARRHAVSCESEHPAGLKLRALTNRSVNHHYRATQELLGWSFQHSWMQPIFHLKRIREFLQLNMGRFF